MDLERDLQELDQELESLQAQAARLSARIEGLQAERDALAAVVSRRSRAMEDGPSAADLRQLTNRRAIVEVLRSSHGPMRVQEIVDVLTSAGRNANYNTVSVDLQVLLADELVRRVDRGLYALHDGSPVERAEPSQRGTSRYDCLRDYLAHRSEPVVRLSFAEIERIIGGTLPASARRHRPWWANERSGTHSHARSWLDAGRRTANVDLNAGTADFIVSRG